MQKKFTKNLLLILIFLILIISSLFVINKFSGSDYIFKKLPIKSQVLIRSISSNKKSGNSFFHFFNNLFNDYNTKFLPETQFIDLDFKTFKVEFDKTYKNKYLKKTDNPKNFFYSFYIEIINDDLLLTDFNGNIYHFDYKELEDKKVVKPTQIKSNLNVDKVLDTFIFNDILYLSYSNKVPSDNVSTDNCYNFNIAKANFIKTELNFKNIYTSKECSKQRFYQTHGGRMQFYEFNKNEGLLITIGDNSADIKSENSIVGKILFLELENNNITVFSEGHRNQQGLFVYENIILSTEHGPRGGDEINKISYGNNYGWPFVSYGEPYGKKLKEPKFEKDHKGNGFEEPLFVFSKAIGISELIKISDNFSKFWNNNFIISSLWAQSIFRVKFDEDFSKVIFYEKIYIGERIRDIKYHNKTNTILLSLEETGKIGIVKPK